MSHHTTCPTRWGAGAIAAVFLGSLFSVAGAGALPDPASITPVEVHRTGDYSEGAVVDHDGNIYMSHANGITKVTPDGEATRWAELAGANGHKVLPDGTHLVCSHRLHAVVHLDAEGHVLGHKAEGKIPGSDRHVDRPNDITLDPHGGFYFTEFIPLKDDRSGAIIHVAGDGTMRTLAEGLNRPNGLALSADRKTLYFVESAENRLLQIQLERPGVAKGQPVVLAELPSNPDPKGTSQPDGIALDAHGNIWIAHFGMKAVQVVSPGGGLLATYDGGNVQTSNLCFAGPERGTLYVTGGKPGALFRLDVGVTGLDLLER